MTIAILACIVLRMLTPSQLLAEEVLGRPIADYIAEKRGARPRWSWELIAEQLRSDTDGKVIVTRETLRNWFSPSTDEDAKAGAAS